MGDAAMSTLKTLYHGSVEIIKKPEFGKGNHRNDYGPGFYCTEDAELAREWACADSHGGFLNIYTIDPQELSILDLTAPQYDILHWMAILVNNRVFDINNDISAEGKAYLSQYFLLETAAFDAINGYRADDAYFSFARDFLSNAITLRQLSRAMRLGNLGEQFVLMSKNAFDLLRFVDSETVDGGQYFARRMRRDDEARKQYLDRESGSSRRRGDLFLANIMDEEMKPGDERLQQIVLE
jgi:hypothetical protein